MPFVPKEEFERYNALEAELHVFDEMRPYLHLAVELRIAMEHAVETADPDLTASEIGDLAYQRVLEAGIAQAREEAVIAYETEHRRALRERVREEVEETEGPTILKRGSTTTRYRP